MHSPSFDLLPLESQQLVRRAVLAVEKDFAEIFGPETVQRFVSDSLQELVASARITRFLPLLTERFARERLAALARAEGMEPSSTPCVLFLCRHNAGRSQIAAGWLKHLTGGSIIVWSAGSEPGSDVSSAAVEVMAEVGIDISAEFPKPWTDEVVRAADVVITMGCGDACPVHPGKRYEDWPVASAGTDLAAARAVRDEIRGRVETLAASLRAGVR